MLYLHLCLQWTTLTCLGENDFYHHFGFIKLFSNKTNAQFSSEATTSGVFLPPVHGAVSST